MARFLILGSGAISTPTSERFRCSSMDTRAGSQGSAFEVTCPPMGERCKPRRQVYYFPHSGAIEEGDGTVCLKGGTSIDREFEI